jgi:hypothetical protein
MNCIIKIYQLTEHTNKMNCNLHYLYYVSNTLKLSNYNPNIYVYDMYIKSLMNPMLLCNLVEEINDDDDDGVSTFLKC